MPKRYTKNWTVTVELPMSLTWPDDYDHHNQPPTLTEFMNAAVSDDELRGMVGLVYAATGGDAREWIEQHGVVRFEGVTEEEM